MPHLFESVAYGINDEKITKGAKNHDANNAKRKNYELVQQKVLYNMMMLHKASLSGKLFIIFHIFTICLFFKIENITLCAFCFCQCHIPPDFGSLIMMAVCLTNSI